MKLDQRLTDMLSYKRPHASTTEAEWIDEFIEPYKPTVFGPKSTPMAYVITVGVSTTLFSAHTDTVHRTEGDQTIYYNEETQCLYKEDDEPLGADDGAGVWLLLGMIDAKVPGTYVFHRGEERGGIGSKWMSDHQSEWLTQFERAIAFDRKATHSVITHQGYGMCCSDDFAQTLSDAFNALDDNFMYAPDDSGVYTDTAEYVDLIAECTNVSCGYYDEHTSKERLFVPHLMALRDACIKLDWSALPVTRQPGEDDTISPYQSFYSTAGRIGRPIDLVKMSRTDLCDLAFEDPDEFAHLVYEQLHGVSAFSSGWEEAL